MRQLLREVLIRMRIVGFVFCGFFCQLVIVAIDASHHRQHSQLRVLVVAIPVAIADVLAFLYWSVPAKT